MGKINNYDFYNRNKEIILESVRRGIVPITIMDRITYYNFYKNELLKNSKMQSIQNTCEEFNISQRTIYRSLKMLTK